MRDYFDYEKYNSYRQNCDHKCNHCHREPRRCHDYCPQPKRSCNNIFVCCDHHKPFPPFPPFPPTPTPTRNAFIFARIIGTTTVEVNDPIPFNITVLSENITQPSPYTTFTFLRTGYYLLNLSITTDIQQITTLVTNTGGPQATTYTLSPITENKVLTAILEITEPNTTLQFINTLGEGTITSATLTIEKFANITV